MMEAGLSADAPTTTRAVPKPTLPIRRPATTAAWSTMGAADLACLVKVLEEEVLPRLIREFRPADRSPLRAPFGR